MNAKILIGVILILTVAACEKRAGDDNKILRSLSERSEAMHNLFLLNPEIKNVENNLNAHISFLENTWGKNTSEVISSACNSMLQISYYELYYVYLCDGRQQDAERVYISYKNRTCLTSKTYNALSDDKKRIWFERRLDGHISRKKSRWNDFDESFQKLAKVRYQTFLNDD